MKVQNRLPQLRHGRLLSDPSVPLLITGLLWFSSPYHVEPSQVVAAFLLVYIPWVLYCRWRHTDKQEFPLLPFILAMYWLAYALPLFWSGREVTSYRGSHSLSDVGITKSMYLAVDGAAAVFLGAILSRRIRWSPTASIDIPPCRSHRRYLGIVLISGLLLRISLPIGEVGSGVRQILSNVETIVPSVAFGLLFRYWLRREATRWEQLLVVVYLCGSVILGIASGWLGSVVAISIVCAAMYAYEQRKLPIVALVIILPVVLFFQPAKEGFRQRYWYSGGSATVGERLWFWVGDSWQMWSQALDDPGSESIKALANQSLGRLSLLQQTANVIELTPEVVPYQYFRLYSYLGVTFIPRFLWQDKPSVNDANIWYQVSYRITPPQGLQGVSVAVGTLTESYISFGWFGPLLIMVPLGMLLALFQRFFLAADRGLVFSTLGAVLIPQFLAIESQLAQYLSGLVQQIAVALLVLLPVLHVYQSTRAGLNLSGTFRFVRSKPRISAAANT